MAPMAGVGGLPEVWPVDPRQALELLMRHFGDMVLRLAYMYLRDHQWAEDVSQEVFVRAYRGWAAFRRESSVKTWLTRITVNACRDCLRSRCWREGFLGGAGPAGVDGAEGPAVRDVAAAGGRSSAWGSDPLENDPEEAAIARVERSVLLGQLMGLAPDLREALFLYYYFGLSTAEIATALGCPEGTVRSRLNRGRERLKEALEREGWHRGRF